MTNPTIRVHDLNTNEVIDREMTAEELQEWQAAKAALEAKAAEELANAAAKSALLEKLGISEQEAKLLLS